MRNSELAFLEHTLGIVLPEVLDFYPDGVSGNLKLAMDAMPALVTVSNSGIPAYLANYIDPKLIEVLIAPTKAAKIVQEVKKGDWTTLTAVFPVIESTGQVSTYGDWNENGSTGANAIFPQRQSYHYQTVSQWGERQLEMAALAKIDWASRINIASAITLNTFQNKSYFFGIAGLQNYGLLNDPSLPATLTPGTKTAGGNKWVTNGKVTADAVEIFIDIQAMVLELATQSKGIIEPDSDFTMAMSPTSMGALTATNSFNVNVEDLVKKNYPNMKFVSAPQYSTAAGELVQLFCDSVEGQETAIVSFTEKMRAHRIVPDTSSFKQKKSQGTWGAIIFQPWAISQMLGV